MNTEKISVEEAKKSFDSQRSMTFLDVRKPKIWQDSKHKLPGAIYVRPLKIDEYKDRLPDEELIITYCT